MTRTTKNGLTPLARALRAQCTDAERHLWFELRDRRLAGAKFRRQVPLGRYVADFACARARLIVELDGGQHAEQVARDAARTRWLEQRGYRVLRFWNDQVLSEMDGVLAAIAEALEQPPSP
jgi:very-short-patch-repair endonuclease